MCGRGEKQIPPRCYGMTRDRGSVVGKRFSGLGEWRASGSSAALARCCETSFRMTVFGMTHRKVYLSG
jgi:hypothetical protein